MHHQLKQSLDTICVSGKYSQQEQLVLKAEPLSPQYEQQIQGNSNKNIEKYSQSGAIRKGKSRKETWTNLDNLSLFQYHRQFGNNWSTIAKLLNRNDNAIKNHFYSTFRRAVRHINKFIKPYCRGFQIKQVNNKALLSILSGAEQCRLKVKTLTPDIVIKCEGIKNQLIKFNDNSETFNKDELIDLIREMLQTNRLIKLQKQQKKDTILHITSNKIKKIARESEHSKDQQSSPSEERPTLIVNEQKMEVQMQKEFHQQPMNYSFMMPSPYVFQLPQQCNGLLPSFIYYMMNPVYNQDGRL